MATKEIELVGPDGVTPLRRDLLTQQVAAAQLGTMRSIMSGHPADDLTPERLAMLLRDAENGSAVAYLELAEQIEERYPHYLSVVGTRKRAVAQLPIRVEAASDSAEHIAHADLVRGWIKRDMLEAEFFDILDAVGKGYSATEIIWKLTGKKWLPAQLKWRDPRWFEFDRVDGETLRLRGLGTPEPLPAFKFITHLHPAKSGLPIRSGLARAAAWSYLFQNFSLKDWVSFAAVFGMPLRIGKYGPGASPDDIYTLMRAVAGISNDAAAVISSSMDIQFENGNTSGSTDLFERLCKYLDQAISKLVLGQTATTDSQGGGLGGSGKEHNDVRGDIERADAKLLAATLNRDVVVPMVDLNFGTQEEYPRIVIGREDALDIDMLTKALNVFVPMGLRVEESQIRDKLGLADPAPDAVLLQAPKSTATPGPENLPVEAPGAKSGGLPPKKPAPGFLDLLKMLQGASPTAAAAADRALAMAAARTADLLPERQDDIDAAAKALVEDGWQEVISPLIQPMLDAIAAAQSDPEMLSALASAIGAMDERPLQALLEGATLAAHLGGAMGADDPGR